MILLDTCALLWYTEDPDKLSPSALSHCERIIDDGAYISSISIWEIGLKIKRKKLDIGTTIEDYLHRLNKLNSFTIVSVDEAIWLSSLQLDWDHCDPADRVIVATVIA